MACGQMLSTRNLAPLVGGVGADIARGVGDSSPHKPTLNHPGESSAMINLEEIREKLGSATTVEESKKIAQYLLGYIRAMTDDVENDSPADHWENLTFRLPPDRPRFQP